MDTRIALIGVLLETRESVDKLNHLLSDYGEYVIGRMGLPYKEKGIHIISIAVDAPNNIISALSGNSECFRASARKRSTAKQRNLFVTAI